jgi:hypothetical protein
MAEAAGEDMVEGMEEATEVAAIMGDMVTATAVAFTEDTDMAGGATLTGGGTPTGGGILTTPIMALITILITTRAMQVH